MPAIPVIGRLRGRDWVRLTVAVTILAIEFMARLLFSWIPTLLLPQKLRASIKNGFEYIGFSSDKRIPKSIRLLAKASSSGRLARLRHVPFETHFCTCKDGYTLTLHRLPRPGGPAVLLWHGFMMSSEVWLCNADPNTSLAFVLHSLGYDVWFGNTRGNKYSWKHERKGMEKTREYYDYSLDEMAKFDVPNSIDFILQFTGKEKLSYIGFSQGTAQGFAALSLSAEIQKKVNIFIALAAVMKPKVLANSIANAVVQASPELIYLIFGRERMIPMAHFWVSVLPRSLLVEAMDRCLLYLFGWTADYISDIGKYIYYGHLYSFTSVKSNVHWFQIMHSEGGFYMYDEYPTWFRNTPTDDNDGDSALGYAKQRFPVEQIRTPVAIFSGGRDTLSDVPFLKKHLGNSLVYWLEIEEYEHLDFLWAEGVDALVIPAVVGLLRQYAEKPALSLVPHPFEVRTITYEAPSSHSNSESCNGGDRMLSDDFRDFDIAAPIRPLNEEDIEWLLARGKIKNHQPPRHLYQDVSESCLSAATSVSGSVTAAGAAVLDHNTISARQFRPKRTRWTSSRKRVESANVALSNVRSQKKTRPESLSAMVRQLSSSLTSNKTQIEQAWHSLLGLADPRSESELLKVAADFSAGEGMQLPSQDIRFAGASNAFPPYSKQTEDQNPFFGADVAVAALSDSDSSLCSADADCAPKHPSTPKGLKSTEKLPTFSTPTKATKKSERL